MIIIIVRSSYPPETQVPLYLSCSFRIVYPVIFHFLVNPAELSFSKHIFAAKYLWNNFISNSRKKQLSALRQISFRIGNKGAEIKNACRTGRLVPFPYILLVGNAYLLRIHHRLHIHTLRILKQISRNISRICRCYIASGIGSAEHNGNLSYLRRNFIVRHNLIRYMRKRFIKLRVKRLRPRIIASLPRTVQFLSELIHFIRIHIASDEKCRVIRNVVFLLYGFYLIDCRIAHDIGSSGSIGAPRIFRKKSFHQIF